MRCQRPPKEAPLPAVPPPAPPPKRGAKRGAKRGEPVRGWPCPYCGNQRTTGVPCAGCQDRSSKPKQRQNKIPVRPAIEETGRAIKPKPQPPAQPMDTTWK